MEVISGICRICRNRIAEAGAADKAADKARRLVLVADLRKQGLTFQQIGERIHTSTGHARTICLQAEEREEEERCPGWRYGLSVRAANTLSNMHIDTRAEATEAFKSAIDPLRRKGLGPATYREIRLWLGLED